MDCDDAAFEDGQGAELARILKKLAREVEAVEAVIALDGDRIHDLNGNLIGTIEVR